MKYINGYWVDDNNNCWDSTVYGEKEAKRLSESLENCHFCGNCESCKHCYYCTDCYNCESDRNCYDCFACDGCCYCGGCVSCCSCGGCLGCVECEHCNHLYKCTGYIEQPQIYVTEKINNRIGCIRFYNGKSNNDKLTSQVTSDGFADNLRFFEMRVARICSPYKGYQSQLLKEIDKAKALFELH